MWRVELKTICIINKFSKIMLQDAKINANLHTLHSNCQPKSSS